MTRFLSTSSARLFGALLVAVASSISAGAQSRTYTLDPDFDEGVLVNVNHTAVHDQLQLDVTQGGAQFDFVAPAVSGRNTLVRFDANTGLVLGEYRTAPNGLLRNPSRTAVDSAGNVWVGNRDESGGGRGSVCRIGICVGGTRVNANGTPNPSGEYLAPPFLYNTCVDRDGDGLIRTSRGLNDVLDWPNVTDGAGGADGIVHDAFDEAIQLFQRTTGTQVQHVSLDGNDDLWAGGYPSFPTAFDRISSVDGAILQSFPAPGCGGHGGVFSNGILWSTSLFEQTVMRYDVAANTGICIPVAVPHGLSIDSQGNVWIAQYDLNAVTKIAPNGTIFPGFPKRSGGASFDRSLAVTFADDNVWVGSSAGNDVSRLDNNGLVRKVISLGANGNSPRGVSVDGNGKVWVTNFGSNNAMRIDPNADADHLGAVDMTVDLGPNASPFNYGTFTGSVPLGVLQPTAGSWDVVYDSGAANTQFGTISWNASVPAGTSFAVSFRASNTVQGLQSVPFTPAVNGQPFSGVFGRFVEIHADFVRANSSVTASPVLFDLTIEALQGPPPPPDCTSAQRNPASLLVFPEFDNRTASTTLLTVTDVDPDGSNVDVEFVYIGKRGPQGQPLDCLEVNRTRRLTPSDTITLFTSFDNPNQSQGYVYAFAKDPLTGHAIVHNSLIGNALVMSGIDAIEYSFNPYAIRGIGEEGTETDHDGDGLRDLNNVEYGCVGDEILIPRFFAQGRGVRSDLVLINLTGGARFTATLDFLAFNDNEEAFSGQIAFQCWDKIPLSDVSNVFRQQFLQFTSQAPNENVNGLETGWIRIDGNIAESSAASFDDPAFLALLVERVGGGGAADLPFEVGGQTNGDLLPRGLFGDTTP